MKKYFPIFVVFLLSTMLVAHSAYAEWEKLTEDATSGDIFYIDNEKIRVEDGDTYFWYLIDHAKKNKYGFWSVKHYYQLNCTSLQYKDLSFTLYPERIGKGIGKIQILKTKAWKDAKSASTLETMLKTVCKK